MEILVNGEVKELVAIEPNHRGIEWIQDLLGNYKSPSYKYDEDKEMHTLSKEDYEWWKEITDKMNHITEMEDKLAEDAWKEYQEECDYDSDLETEVNGRLNWLTEKLGLSSND